MRPNNSVWIAGIKASSALMREAKSWLSQSKKSNTPAARRRKLGCGRTKRKEVKK